MKWVVPLAIAGTFSSLSSADVLDLGDLDQYNAQLTALPPDIGSNAVWVGQGTGGYDVALSPDIKSKVQGVLDGCGEVNHQCYQDITEVFRSADLEMDGALDRRGFASLLSKTFKASAAIFLDIAAALMANWKMRQQEVQELGLWIPDSKASDAGSIATATDVTISAGGAPVVTITQTPDVTQLQGTATPAVTAVTVPSDGYASGDLVALLDQDLASRIDELMHRAINCQDGQTFDSQHPSSKKRAGATLGQAICGAEAVAAGAVPGGPFNDLLLLSPTDLPFGFADAAGATAQAAGVVADFVLAYAPLLTIGPELADQLAVYLFALALDSIVENIPLADKNRIQSSMVTTGTSIAVSSTLSSCPDPTATPLLCGMDGQDCDVQMPVAPATDITCQSGQYQGCNCNAPPVLSINLVSPEQQQTMIYMSALLNTAAVPPVESQADCPMNVDTIITPIPASIFSSDNNKVYPHYCEQWHSDTASKMTVDSSGNNRLPEPHLRRRTPPPNAADWTNWNFDLSFTPTPGGSQCSTDCNGAYGKIGSACASNSGGVYMYSTGKLDVGCGIFDYTIDKPTTALATQDQFCYRVEDFAATGGDVNSDWVSQYSGWACAGTGLTTIKKDDKSTFRQFYTETNNAPYQYNVWWKDGCALDDNGPTEVYASNPLGVNDPGHTVCQDFLVNDWKNCNNKGVGGNIQVGCLIYEFKADRNKRVF